MIYLHVPFCRSFCTYCDFYSEIACKGRKNGAAVARWADEVCKEISSRRKEIESTLDLDTLYIGGGTPSVLPLSVLRRILGDLEAIRDGGSYSEFTIEVNPEDIVERGPEYVQGLLDLGVTRFSMGVQSLDDGILRWMNRRHSADGARKAFNLIQSAAHGEILPRTALSIDLITGVPGMTAELLDKTLEEVVRWRPEHISAYQLSIEEGSVLAKMIENGSVAELDEECCRMQYELVCRRLSEAGYHHYEISNWALPGREAVHNSAYWTRHPYVGLGPGAHSLIFYDAAGRPDGRAMSIQSGPLPVADCKQRRSWNSQTLGGWTSEYEILSAEQIREEEVMLLARTDRGPIPEKDWFIADEIIADLL